MGVISIRSSSAQLGNLGATPVRQVHMPSYQVNKRTGKPDAIASQQHIARGMQDLGRAVLDITLSLKRDQTNIALNEAEAEYEKAVRERMMDPQGGFLTMNLNNSGAIESFAKDSTKMLDDMREEIAKKHELSGGTREVFNNRTQGVYSGWSRQIAGRTLQAHDTLKKNAAANLTEQKYQDWQLNPFDSDTTKELVDCFRAQCYTNGDDDQAAAANVDKYCRGLAFDYVTHTVKGIQDEKGIEAAIEKLEKDPSGMLAFNQPLAEYFGSKSPFDRKGANSMRGILEQRRREIQARDIGRVDEAANVGVMAVAAIRDKDGNYPKDRLPTIEGSITHLTDLSNILPKGSAAATQAATKASDLNAKADMIAQQEMIDEYLAELRTDPNAKIYIAEERGKNGEVTSPSKNSYIGQGRKERLAPMVQQMVDQQRQSGADSPARKANFANWKLKMLNGAKNPGEYHNEIFKAAQSGELTLDEYQKLKSEFDSSWAEGFTPGQKSPKQLAAEGMLGVLQEFFPSEDLDASYEWDKKTGGLKLKKDAPYSGLKYEIRDRGGFWRGLGDLYEFPSTSTTHKMGSDQVEKIVNVATALSFYDGMQLDFDPITGKDVDFFTGEKIKTGKDAPAFNAANYFKQYLGRLKDEDKAIAAADYIMQLVQAEANLFNSFSDVEEGRRADISERQKTGAKKTVTIKNRKTGEGVTTKK